MNSLKTIQNVHKVPPSKLKKQNKLKSFRYNMTKELISCAIFIVSPVTRGWMGGGGNSQNLIANDNLQGIEKKRRFTQTGGL